MISGSVNARHEAVVRLRLRGPSGIEAETDAVVDTGFTAALTLPAQVIASLGLIRKSRGQAILADGSIKFFDIFASEVEWGAARRAVLISAVGEEALMGMRMLAGHELRIEVVPGGAVEIVAKP